MIQTTTEKYEIQQERQDFDQFKKSVMREIDEQKHAAKIVGTLKSYTSSIATLNEKAATIKSKMASGEYGPAYNSQLMEISKTVKDREAEALGKCKEFTQSYIDAVSDDFVLKPERLTADAQFLTMGFPLTVSDVVAMAKRNSTNPTMLRLIRHYADQHKVELPSDLRVDLDRVQQVQNARDIQAAVELYVSHWISTDKGPEMLDRFFGSLL